MNYIITGYNEKEINNYSKSFGNGFAYVSYPEIKKHPRDIAKEIDKILFTQQISNQPVIITTLSDIPLNYICWLITKEKVQPNEFNVHLVKSKKELIVCEYTNNGRLTNWQPGFFCFPTR